jgi:hypothetical protein
MPPATVRALGRARLAAPHRQARRDALARAARRARPPRQQSGPPGPRLPAAGRGIRTGVAARSALVLINAFARIVRTRGHPAGGPAAVLESFFEGLVDRQAPQTDDVPLKAPNPAHDDSFRA